MEVKIIKEDEKYMEISIDNLTIVEIIRKFLWENKSTLVCGWSREHPTKPAILKIKTKSDAKNVLKGVIEKLKKEVKEIKSEVKKIK